MENEIMNVNDLAKYLKIGRSKAYKLINSSGFPAIRIGKNIRIMKHDLNNWLNNNHNHDIVNFELESRKEEF